jgi:hypothetical protein
LPLPVYLVAAAGRYQKRILLESPSFVPSGLYHALYGDLHWADLTTDQLPEVPKP